MADFDDYDPDAIDDGDKDDDDYHRESTKERIIALVDADAAMLGIYEDHERSMSFIAWAMNLVQTCMETRIKQSPNDEVGVVFYSTKQRSESDELRVFDHVYEYVKLDVPDAATIRRLRDFKVSEFQASPGCDDVSISPGRAAEDLKNGLFACWDMLTRGSASSNARVDKTILLFTNNQDPLSNAGGNAPHLREQLLNRARELGGLAVSIELMPLVQLQDPEAFDYGPFWRQLLSECAAAARGAGDGLSLEGQEAASQMDEQQEGLGRKMQRVQGMVQRMNRKRPLAALAWQLGPDFKIGVQLYALVQPQKKPSHKYLTRDRADVVASSNALISADTGTILSAASHKAFLPKDQGRFPKVIMSKSEEKELRTLRPKSLTLLGFKPASCLADHHQMGPARFVYPDERHLKGSTAAFAALHRACLLPASGRQMAVCSFVRASGAMPQLVALLPQEQQLGEDGEGAEWQEVPPGFHMITLPFRDDLRTPEADSGLLDKAAQPGGGPARANTQQVEAAEALLAGLTLDFEGEQFSSTDIANPHLERHWQVLEDLALSHDPRPLDALEDETKPVIEDIDVHEAILDAFKLAVWGSIEGPSAPEKKGKTAAGSKRKAADSAEQLSVAEEYSQHDWAKLAAAPDGKAGSLSKLTNDKLKLYLKYHGLPVSGNKADLLARIKDHLAGNK